MKIKKLEKAFNKMMKEELKGCGFTEIDRVIIYPKTKGIIMIEGRYGSKSPDGKIEWQERFTLECNRGQSLEFLKGMLLQAATSI